MRLTSLSSIVLIMVLLSCDNASNVDPVFEDYFTKYYGEDGEQEGVDIALNSDGSMILLGNSFSQTDPISPFLVKTDALGNVVWQRTFKRQNETAADVEIINQGAHLALVSNVSNGPNTPSNICLYILNQDDGSVVDSLYITGNENQLAESVTQTSDNSFLITGLQDPDASRNPGLITPPPDQADVLLLKVNNSLDAYDYLSPGGGEHIGSGVKAYDLTLDGTVYYLVFGYSDKPRQINGAYQQCFQLISVVGSSSPTGLRGFSEAEPNEEQVASMTLKIPQSLGDGYLTVGTTSSGTGFSNLYLTRFNKPTGPNTVTTSLDTKIPLGRRIEGISAANAAPDGYFIVANEIRENSRKDIFLLRVERDGFVTWTTSFGSLEGEDTAGGVEALPDGRIAVVGTIELETQKKMALVVTNGNGKFSD